MNRDIRQPLLERSKSWRVGPYTTLSVTTPAPKPPKKKPALSPTLIRYLFVLSFAWQFANVCVIVLTDVAKNHQDRFDIAVAFMMLFQLIHIGLVISTSIKLCKQVLHKTASPLFVVQSFLSTTLLYAGLYTLLLSQDCFIGFTDPIYTANGPSGTFHIFVKFVYFSTATMTTVGYGDVVPAVWYTQLIVTSEMLLSVTYTVVIFAQGLSHFNTPLILEHDSSLPSENAPQ